MALPDEGADLRTFGNNKKTVVRSRMPFPDFILSLALVVIALAAVLPLYMRNEEPMKTGATRQNNQVYASGGVDPFSDGFDRVRSDEAPGSLVIKTNFVEIGSGEEELGFDWLIPESDDFHFNEGRRK